MKKTAFYTMILCLVAWHASSALALYAIPGTGMYIRPTVRSVKANHALQTAQRRRLHLGTPRRTSFTQRRAPQYIVPAVRSHDPRAYHQRQVITFEPRYHRPVPQSHWNAGFHRPTRRFIQANAHLQEQQRRFALSNNRLDSRVGLKRVASIKTCAQYPSLCHASAR